MKNKIIKLISAVVCTALIFTVTAVVPTVIHGAQSDDVVLFYNDRAWTLARLPVEQIHNIYYVPITFMAQLPEVEIQVDSSCCAGVTPESHLNALSAMKMCQISVI